MAVSYEYGALNNRCCTILNDISNTYQELWFLHRPDMATGIEVKGLTRRFGESPQLRILPSM